RRSATSGVTVGYFSASTQSPHRLCWGHCCSIASQRAGAPGFARKGSTRARTAFGFDDEGFSATIFSVTSADHGWNSSHSMFEDLPFAKEHRKTTLHACWSCRRASTQAACFLFRTRQLVDATGVTVDEG